jgi:hypothetical protein
VLAVVVQTIIDLAIEAELLNRIPDDDANGELSRMPVYLGIFAFAQ